MGLVFRVERLNLGDLSLGGSSSLKHRLAFGAMIWVWRIRVQHFKV